MRIRALATTVMLSSFVLLFDAEVTAAQDRRSARLGGALRAGIQLVYASAGVETPWTIDSLAADTTLGGRAACVRLRLRLAPTTPQTTRAFCADSAVLLAWDDRTGAHRAARPIVARDSLQLRGGGASTTTFETGTWSADTISGRSFRVLETSVVTRDSTGRVVRRLRERFSLDLLTATVGVFEVHDPAQPGGWRVEREFRLMAIK